MEICEIRTAIFETFLLARMATQWSTIAALLALVSEWVMAPITTRNRAIMSADHGLATWGGACSLIHISMTCQTNGMTTLFA